MTLTAHQLTTRITLLFARLAVAVAGCSCDWAQTDNSRFLTLDSMPRDGLFPSFSNGFLAGDAGCSNVSVPDYGTPSTKGGSCGRVHLAGVFSNFTYYDDDDAQSYPQRAAISNPFSVTMSGKNNRFIGAALDISIGKTHNRSLISCQDSTESAEGEMIEVETSIWAHREDRNLLIFEVRALNLTQGSCGGTGQVTVSFESCGIGAAGTSEAFILEEKESPVDGVVVWQLTVRAMEVPPAGTKIPPPTQTQVGLAYQTVPKTLVLSAHVPASRYRAVFHSSLEFEEGGMNHSSSASKPISSYSVQHLQSLLNSDKDGSASSEVGSWAKSDAEHEAAWDEVWAGGIEVEGNATIAAAVNASLFAIVASLRADWPYGVSPGGLTHNAYCGHSFWDGETWMGPSLLTLFPNLGHSLLQYRALRLPAAQENARLLGVCGEESADSEEDRVPCASWPWESALLGFGVSPWIDGDKYEIHIAGDIALSLELAFRVSGNDPSFFTVESASNSSEAAYWPVIGASAAFFAAKAAVEASTSNYTFLNVIGPDESAGVVNDSAYTNAIASKTLKWAIEAAGIVGSIPGSNWSAIASNVFLPITLLPGSETLGHPEYSGYDGENINQADVALLQYPLGWEMPSEVAHADLVFYEQRSSTPDTKQFYTGDSAYSVAWLRLGGNKTAADAQFLQGLFHIDLQEDEYCDCASGFGVWKETLDGGNLNFLTGAGGWVQNLIFGYGGLQYTKKGSLAVLFPSLPPGGVTALVLRGITLGYGSRRVRFNIRFDNSEATFSLSGVEDRNVPVSVIDGDGMVYNLPVSLPVAQQFEVMLL